jgi:acyl CoA:acetate/3-ketoacid CoA transferase alpha subunit
MNFPRLKLTNSSLVITLGQPASEDKLITLEEVTKKVPDGAHIAWGGFGYQRPPEAFAMELIRQKKRGIRVYTCGSEHDLDNSGLDAF